MIKFRGARIGSPRRRHRAARGGRGAVGGIGRAVHMHPIGFGLPAVVIAAAAVYLVLSGHVRSGPPASASPPPSAAAPVPTFPDPPSGPAPGRQARSPGAGAPVQGYVPAGYPGNVMARHGGRGPRPRSAAPVAASSRRAPAAGTSPAPLVGHSTCIDLGLLSLCL